MKEQKYMSKRRCGSQPSTKKIQNTMTELINRVSMHFSESWFCHNKELHSKISDENKDFHS